MDAGFGFVLRWRMLTGAEQPVGSVAMAKKAKKDKSEKRKSKDSGVKKKKVEGKRPAARTHVSEPAARTDKLRQKLKVLTARVTQLGEEVAALRKQSAQTQGEDDSALTDTGRLERPAGPPDDLRLITGVGPTLAARMQAAGIFHFWQLGTMTDHDIAMLEQDLLIAGRIVRDDWRGQAKRLMSGAPSKASG